MRQPTTEPTIPVDRIVEWQALREHFQEMENVRLADLFQRDPDRFHRFSLDAPGIFFDYSKNRITARTLDLLLALAEKRGLRPAIDAMFAGEPVNSTENRPVLHVVLRSPEQSSEEGRMVHWTLARMSDFVHAVLDGTWRGAGGGTITDVVNIGIGGSDLGPAMACQALAPYHVPGLTCHFVSNVDPAHLARTLEKLDPETTLFIIASKSFTTLETARNAAAARRWALEALGDETRLPRHFVAVTANGEKAVAFGIEEANIFPMWDWVGGRYSLWSTIGLPIALGVGMDNFQALLQGGHAMDEHFRGAPLESNMPAIMGLLAVWYLNFFQAESQVVLPYDQNLWLFPAFLQQLDMESLGKSVQRDGTPAAVPTGGILWGSAGTNGQHSFHQLLHQGTHLVPADFIAVAQGHYGNPEQHRHLLANCLAQSQALMTGKTLEQARAELVARGMDESEAGRLAPHKTIPGNRPSNTLVLRQLTPETLGALVAAYEHKVYTQSVILGINAFDQWGVELGKVLSTGIVQAMSAGREAVEFDTSTNGLINYCRFGE